MLPGLVIAEQAGRDHLLVITDPGGFVGVPMTPQQLKTEIETGPLSQELAGPWGNVFPTELQPSQIDPEITQETRDRWERIKHRFGKLTPDGIYDLLRILNTKTRSKPQQITVAAFTRLLAGRGLLRKLKVEATQQGPVGDICDLIVTITNSAPESKVDPADPEVLGMIDAVVMSGIATADDKTAFLTACSQPCSRAEELGWTVTESDLNAAKEIQ